MDFATAHKAAQEALDRSARDVERLLGPHKGIAFVGSADVTPDTRRQFARYGDNVKICIVNPKGGEAGDFPIYKSMLDVPDEIDLAVIRVAAKRTIQVIEDCGKR